MPRCPARGTCGSWEELAGRGNPTVRVDCVGGSENDARGLCANESGDIDYAISASRRHLWALSEFWPVTVVVECATSPGEIMLDSLPASVTGPTPRATVGCRGDEPTLSPSGRSPSSEPGGSVPGPLGGVKSVRFLGLFEARFHKIAHSFTETSGFSPRLDALRGRGKDR